MARLPDVLEPWLHKSSPARGGGPSAQANGGGGQLPTVLQQPIEQVKRARALRKTMSLPEVLLWRELRKHPGGFRFRRQLPMHPYTLDFACLSARLVIEVDGEAHNRRDQPERDVVRDRFLVVQGFHTLRIPARDVLKDIEACVRYIVNTCDERLAPSTAFGGPPPRSGEDFIPETTPDSGEDLDFAALRSGEDFNADTLLSDEEDLKDQL